MTVKIEIKKRNRDWGILTWCKPQDAEIKEAFKGQRYIEIEIDGKKVNKRVWYSLRKISISKKKLIDKNYFIIESDKNNNLRLILE